MSPSVRDLTPKQRRAYDLLKVGNSPDEAAVAMGITRQGVYQHMKKIRNLGLSLPGDEPAQSTPPAEPAASPSTNGHASPEVALRAAFQAIDDRLGEIDEQIASLTAEREELVGKYEAALAALT